jgi:hypothetical protein
MAVPDTLQGGGQTPGTGAGDEQIPPELEVQSLQIVALLPLGIVLQQFVGHAAFLSFGQVLFLQVITVLAAQVT